MLGVIKAAKLLKRSTVAKGTVRKSHEWYYRSATTKPQKKAIYIAEGVQGFTWWWILWHLWTEPGHVIGEFPFPNPNDWTDEELGIPPE